MYSRFLQQYTGMKYKRGMSIKKENDSVHEKNNAVTTHEDSKAISYFRSFISSSQTLQKKEKQDKNEPARFLGDGVSFKAKLIGILEVNEARGDKMCQEALADLKMAIRAAGEHKQRININIAIDGLRLRDEKTGDCLYHHPVHKISFIAQDSSDNRAFGYIFGSPDTGHRFFGIKTDKNATQVVITMRDLFQVVYELKKKEIEMAKQHFEHAQIKFSSSLFPDSLNKASVDAMKIRTNEDHGKSTASALERRDNQEDIIDLLDLELELNNIQQGINQMDRITPSDPFGPAVSVKPVLDPFGDSFNPLQNRTKIPPPPDTGKKSKMNERHWFDQETEALFKETELSSTMSSHKATSQSVLTMASFPVSSVSPVPELSGEETGTKKLDSTLLREQFDVFTDLDPLGTGKSKPYIDKKDFFQDLKNPPKKVLKDLVTELPIDCKQNHVQGECDCDNASSQQNAKSDQKKNSKSSLPVMYADPFQTDPFDKDPFSEVDFSQTVFTPTSSSDPFEKFADFASFDNKKEENSIDKTKKPDDDSKSTPLKVSLPPEKLGSIDSTPMSPHQSRKLNKLQKNNTISCIIKPPSPVPKRNKFITQPSLDQLEHQLERNSPIMEGVTIRSRTSSFYPSIPSSSFSETAPEPPPRSALNSLAMKPPPLPPKRLAMTASSKPPPRPPQSDYDYIENYHTTTSYTDVNSPPLPAPLRKINVPKKPTVESEYYLQPFPLLPPPKKKAFSPTPISKDPFPIIDASAPTKGNTPAKSSLDITLSQLTKTGFSDLAATLNMSPTSLSKMTLQDLTKCLASLANDSHAKEGTVGKTNSDDKNAKTNILNSDCYSALRESIEEDNVSFTAEFESHFNTNNDTFESKTEESLFDKYAVFRELLEEEKKNSSAFPEDNSESNIQTQNQRGFEEHSENVEKEKTIESHLKKEDPVEDRYAALRDICIDETIEEKYDPDLSDKEDSVIEPSRLEEDTDLLPHSRPHSESTESPTVTMKEHQSIIEATIMEEDISALEVDEEEVLDESVDETIKEPLNQAIDNKDHRIQSVEETNEKDAFSPVVQSNNNIETKQTNEGTKSDTTSWAKFDVEMGTGAESRSSIHSEGHVSPWSAESKDNDLSPACRDKRKHKKVRRHKQNVWHEDDESEEGWEMRPDVTSWSPSRRENGWSDGDSLYDEALSYVEHDYHSPRKGRRRRMSPWNSRDHSPWEEDDRDLRDDQWESPRWQNEPRQRPKHRGTSWEDERRRHYEDQRKSRKPVMWSSDIDRKSSRESLTWEDEERYSKRNYGDRRRRVWDDDFHNRNRWRERDWLDSGMKMSNRYYKERSHDMHYDVEYSDHADDECGHLHECFPQRPRSCERGRRPFSIHHSSETDFFDRSDRRYARSRDAHGPPDDYRRKAHTLQSQKSRRKHSQTSPFEDDFTSQFGFSKDMPSPMGSDAFESETKQSTTPFEPNAKSFGEQVKQSDFSQYGQSGGHDFNRENSKASRVYQQSPFEDDFTPPEARRCSGRSASSELSDQRGSDDMYFSNVNESAKLQRSDVIRRPKSATHAESLSRRKLNNKPSLTSEHHNISDNPRDNSHTDCDQVEINTAQHINERKQANIDFKHHGSVKRSDSSNSLRKSESVNIFARNNDPFDDDFFCEESTKINRNKEKISKNIISDTKWNESFDTFSFDDK